MGKNIKIIYFVNFAIILIALFMPIMNLLLDSSYSNKIHTGYYAVFAILSITFCIPFFGLNLYGVLKYKEKRAYVIITILLAIWIIWGIFQILNGYFHDISL